MLTYRQTQKKCRTGLASPLPKVKKSLRKPGACDFGAGRVSYHPMNERISIKPDVCNGRPVVRGTRITVQTVLEFLAAGDSVENVLEEYPRLTRADVKACLD